LFEKLRNPRLEVLARPLHTLEHTYGIGFHNLYGLRQTLRLDEELARHLRLIGP